MSASPSPLRWRLFPTPDALAELLAHTVAQSLREALMHRGHAVLAVSGGTTPRRFFERLSRAAIDWSRVVVTLVDERWVGEDSERSNARLVREHLLQNAAAAAAFVPLYDAAFATPEEAQPAVEARLRSRLPIDVLLLGMGGDGHFASLFPGGDRLAQGLDPHTAAMLIPMRAEAAGEPRLGLTLGAILRARQVILHIEGAAKRGVLERADAGDAALPIHALLQSRQAFLPCYWSP